MLFPLPFHFGADPDSRKGVGRGVRSSPCAPVGLPRTMPGWLFNVSKVENSTTICIFGSLVILSLFSCSLKSSQPFPSAQGDPIPGLGGETGHAGIEGEASRNTGRGPCSFPQQKSNKSSCKPGCQRPETSHGASLSLCFAQQMSPRAREKHNLFPQELPEKPAPTFLQTHGEPNYLHLVFWGGTTNKLANC